LGRDRSTGPPLLLNPPRRFRWRSSLDWLAHRYTAALADLKDSGLLLFDPGAQVIGITRWFRHNPPLSEDHLTGIERQLERLPSETIAKAMAEDAQEAWGAVQAEKAARAERKKKPAPSGAGNGSHSLNQTPFMRR